MVNKITIIGPWLSAYYNPPSITDSNIDYTIFVSSEADEILTWAKNKMLEETMLTDSSSQHPAVREAVDLVRQANERLSVVLALTKKD
jgi:hypothetical protein